MFPKFIVVCLRMDKDKDEAAKDKVDEKRDKDKAARDDDVNVLIVTSTANGPADWKSDGDDLGIEDGNVAFGKPVSRLHLNNLKRSHDVLAAAHDVAERKDRIVKARIEVEKLQLEVFKKRVNLTQRKNFSRLARQMSKLRVLFYYSVRRHGVKSSDLRVTGHHGLMRCPGGE